MTGQKTTRRQKDIAKLLRSKKIEPARLIKNPPPAKRGHRVEKP